MAVFMETEDKIAVSASPVKAWGPGQFGVNTSNSKAAKSDKQKVIEFAMK